MWKCPQIEESLEQVWRWKKTIMVGAEDAGGHAAHGMENMQESGYTGALHTID